MECLSCECGVDESGSWTALTKKRVRSSSSSILLCTTITFITIILLYHRLNMPLKEKGSGRRMRQLWRASQWRSFVRVTPGQIKPFISVGEMVPSFSARNKTLGFPSFCHRRAFKLPSRHSVEIECVAVLGVFKTMEQHQTCE